MASKAFIVSGIMKLESDLVLRKSPLLYAAPQRPQPHHHLRVIRDALRASLSQGSQCVH